MKKWIKRKLINFMIALHWTENALKTNSNDIRVGEGQYQSHRQGMLSDSLVNGEVTQEVMELRWRLYKVIQHADKITAVITGFEEDGTPIVETKKATPSRNRLRKYSCEQSDDEFKLIMVVPNQTIDFSTVEALDSLVGAGDNAEIKRDDFISRFKTKRTLMCTRDHLPMFNLEDYTDKLLIREMTDDRVLLEFYVNKYPTENKKSRFFVSEMKRILAGQHRSPILDFQNVFFISNKVLGADNNLEFDFKLLKFHRIVEFGGHYVVKFVAEKVVFGDNILEKYRMADLDEKYKNKEKK